MHGLHYTKLPIGVKEWPVMDWRPIQGVHPPLCQVLPWWARDPEQDKASTCDERINEHMISRRSDHLQHITPIIQTKLFLQLLLLLLILLSQLQT